MPVWHIYIWVHLCVSARVPYWYFSVPVCQIRQCAILIFECICVPVLVCHIDTLVYQCAIYASVPYWCSSALVCQCSCAILILRLTPGTGIRSSYILQRMVGCIFKTHVRIFLQKAHTLNQWLVPFYIFTQPIISLFQTQNLSKYAFQFII